MQYYYDVLGNFSEYILKFYEWESNDDIVNIKKIPFIKISKEDMRVLLSYSVILEMESIVRNSKDKTNYLLFSTGCDALMVELNQEGKIIYYSSLLIEDELEVNELAHSMNTIKLKFKVLDKIKILSDYRQGEKAKNLIFHELKKIKDNDNKDECLYYYYEWFHVSTDDYDKAIKKMFLEIKKPFNKDMERIEKLIRLSYKEKL